MFLDFSTLCKPCEAMGGTGFSLWSFYSYRSATTGEIRVARIAGTVVASRTTSIIPNGAAANFSVSVTPTPNSIVLSKRGGRKLHPVRQQFR